MGLPQGGLRALPATGFRTVLLGCADPGKWVPPGASTLTFITFLYILPAASAKLKRTCEKPSGRQKKLQSTWKKLQSTWKKLSGR